VRRKMRLRLLLHSSSYARAVMGFRIQTRLGRAGYS
jgi:hypothetical protein